ncbi:unnamed protein product [Peronospora destructor]|nr:unnamed protein product [Peronospora destructor]
MLTIIAGLRAENKSLLDQNTILRSLVTNCKQERASSQSDHQLAAFTSLPPSPDQSCVALNMLESGQKMDVDDDAQAADIGVMTLQPGKRRTMASKLSMTSVAVSASLFGITVFVDGDGDGDAVDATNIRGVGRVLHEAPTSCGIEGCSFEASMSPLRFVATMVRSWVQLLSSSELVFGVLLNVLSFVVIVALYQLWQSHSAGGWSEDYAVLSKSGRRHAQRQAELSWSSSCAIGKFKEKRNGSGPTSCLTRDDPICSDYNIEA